MIKMYTDAAVLYDHQKSGGGILIINNHHQTQLKVTLNPTDNHEAEFNTCLLAFQKLLTLVDHPENTIVTYYTDSKIIFDSLEKKYAKHYQKWVDDIVPLEQQFNLVLHNLISDRQNEGAHQLAQQALHQS